MQTLRENAVGRAVPLFEATLAYKDGMAPLVRPAQREGVLIGSGQGQIEGERIQGSLRWSMYAADCAYLFADFAQT
ncbi:MAG: hypothetical protein H3C34_14075 [Caldilineaceae bacterium]|nr:hypothetical protein [Caldilineaceae bacterium]